MPTSACSGNCGSLIVAKWLCRPLTIVLPALAELEHAENCGANGRSGPAGVVVGVSGAEGDSPRLSASFRTVYRDHFEMVWRALLRLGVPADHVEDAVQDVFLVVHRRDADFAGRSTLRTWIYGISVRVAKDHRRTQARHRQRLLGFKRELKALAEPPSAPGRDAEQREAARLTQRVLNEMDEEERDVLVLVELEDLSIAEAAAALDLHVRTCQRRLRAARDHFEVLLEAAFAGSATYSNQQKTEVAR